MKYTVPHYYKRFECTAGDCPDTCCADWTISIDKASLKRYRKTKGSLKNRLYNSIDWKAGSFKQYRGHCVLLNDEGLCDLYCESGPLSLCKTCKTYPRHMEDFQDVREWSLSLSCVEAAKMILGCEEPVRFLSRENEESELYHEFDSVLFAKLMDSRALVFRFLQNRAWNLSFRMAMSLTLSHDLQLRVSRKKPAEIPKLLNRYKKAHVSPIFQKKLAIYQVSEEEHYRSIGQLFLAFDRLDFINADWFMADEVNRKEFAAYLKTDEKRKAEWERWGEQLMVYFVFTYFCGAVYDADVYTKMKMAIASTLFIQELAGGVWQVKRELTLIDMSELAHCYAKAVEHSDRKLNQLEQVLKRDEAFSLENLMRILSAVSDEVCE